MYLSTTQSKVSIVVIVLSFTLGLITSCAEHPTRKEPAEKKEHPEKTEQPEHPEGKEKSEVTLEDVAKFAEAYVKENSEEGVFKFFDDTTGTTLELTLDKVHRERLSQTKKDEYFVCADFKGKDGNMYDLDFFVQGENKDNLKIIKESISVHKVNGKENYTWKYNKKQGVWEKQAVKTGLEHPAPPKKEHPGY